MTKTVKCSLDSVQPPGPTHSRWPLPDFAARYQTASHSTQLIWMELEYLWLNRKEVLFWEPGLIDSSSGPQQTFHSQFQTLCPLQILQTFLLSSDSTHVGKSRSLTEREVVTNLWKSLKESAKKDKRRSPPVRRAYSSACLPFSLVKLITAEIEYDWRPGTSRKPSKTDQSLPRKRGRPKPSASATSSLTPSLPLSVQSIFPITSASDHF